MSGWWLAGTVVFGAVLVVRTRVLGQEVRSLREWRIRHQRECEQARRWG